MYGVGGAERRLHGDTRESDLPSGEGMMAVGEEHDCGMSLFVNPAHCTTSIVKSSILWLAHSYQHDPLALTPIRNYMALRVLFLATTVTASSLTPVLKLRGGMEMGPITSDNVGGVLKVAAAVTAAGAISEKYAGLGETTLTKTFKGDVWTTNVIIAMVTGVATSVIYSVGASDFDAGKLGSALWLVSVLMKLKESGFDVSSLMNDPVETIIALLSTLLAWA